jgi:ammonium transporter Rh
MPGLFGGLVAIVVIPGIAKAQLAGIAFTIALALAGGLIADYIIRATGSKKNIYEDHEEFIQTEQKGTVLEY